MDTVPSTDNGTTRWRGVDTDKGEMWDGLALVVGKGERGSEVTPSLPPVHDPLPPPQEVGRGSVVRLPGVGVLDDPQVAVVAEGDVVGRVRGTTRTIHTCVYILTRRHGVL